MFKSELLYEGKAKRVYAAEGEGLCIMEYKNTATAFNGVKREEILHKGQLNCAICTQVFQYLSANGVPTHFVKRIDDTSMLVQRVDIVPLEVIVRNVTAGSFSQKYGVAEGIVLNQPSFEFSYKNDALGDPMINRCQIIALGLAKSEDIAAILELAATVNRLLISYFERAGLRLIDFKLEFGRINGEIVLADEVSPDTCRLWDVNTSEKLDKDRFRRDLGGVTDAYQEVYRRLSAANGGI